MTNLQSKSSDVRLYNSKCRTLLRCTAKKNENCISGCIRRDVTQGLMLRIGLLDETSSGLTIRAKMM